MFFFFLVARSNAQFNSGGDPRKESFTSMLAMTCCPTLQWKSVLVILTVIQTIMFVISIILTYASTWGVDSNADFLEPNTIVLVTLGCKFPYRMQKGGIHRFLLPLFLHANFLHIFMNVIAQLINGWIEIILGRNKMIALYLISGIGGNLFSSLISDDLAVGASTAILGILACQLAYLFVYWKALERFGFLRCCMLFQCIFMVLIGLTFGLGIQKNIDNYGHLGGFITGFLAGVALFTPLSTEIEAGKKWRMAAVGGLVVFFFVGILCFFLAKDPKYFYVPDLKFK